jgi:integrase
MKAKLTHRTVATLKAPETGILDVWDANLVNFGVRMAASGLKTFFVRYRAAGARKRRRLKLGTFPSMSLRQARELARKKLSEAELGKDPAGKKAEERKAPTFEGLAELYLDKHAIHKRSGREDKRIIQNELYPLWRRMHAKAIKRADVFELLDPIAERAPIMANRVLACARKVFNFGIQRDLVQVNPCTLIPMPSKERQRDRVLSDEEIRAVWRELDVERLPVSSVLRLRLLTAQRGGEVLTVRWPDLDFETAWWTIPSERSKNGLPHRVPLSAQSLRILEELHRQSEDPIWVFPSPRGGAPMGDVHKAVYRIKDRTDIAFVGHDLRRTAASHMTSMGISRLVVSRILNHAENDVTAVYDRHSYDPEKRQALELWGRRVEEIVTGKVKRGSLVTMVR